MNIFPQTPTQPIVREQREMANEDSSEPKFREFLRVSKTKEKEQKKSFFKLVEEEDSKNMQGCAAALSEFLHTAEEVAPSILCTGATLPAEIEALFEKMASCMLVMSSSREVKTTLLLNHPRFSSSVFFGSKITISEFSTAPKIFNVEIISNPLATAMIDASKNDLLSAFQYGKFPFAIHRLDTEIEKNEPSLIQQVESGSEKEEEHS